MPTYSHELKIPKERVAVIIGKNGEIKKNVEKATKTVIDVDSKEGDVIISGSDALKLYTAREIIIAIGRGFNPEIAMLLLKQDYLFEIISLADFAKSKESVLRLKGRVIGKEGKSRALIEELADCSICVYGKTIGIIGTPESNYSAKHAIESLLRGSPHSHVYRWLERRRRELKRQDLTEM